MCLYKYIYIYSLYNLSHLSRISRTSPRYPKVSFKFRSRRGHCLLVFNVAKHRRFTSFSTYEILKLTKLLGLTKKRMLEKILGIWKIPKSFRNASEYIKHVGKKAKVCRFAYGFHMSTTRNLSKVRQNIMPLAKPCILSTFDRRKVVWKAQHFPKEHLKCTETQCVFHSSKSYVFISSLRNVYHFST